MSVPMWLPRKRLKLDVSSWAVHRGAAGVVVELVVMGPRRVAAGAPIAQPVVMTVGSGHLDRVAGHVEASVAVDVGSAAGIDARVAVAVGLAVRDEAVVGGEAQEPVLRVPAADHIVDPETVSLDDVDRVESGFLGDEVAQVKAFRSIGS